MWNKILDLRYVLIDFVAPNYIFINYLIIIFTLRLLIPNRKPALKENDEKNCVVVTQIKQCKFKAAVEKVKQFKGKIIFSHRSATLKW